jgi:hypothetical protein
MKKSVKILLGIIIPILIIGTGLGGYKIYEILQESRIQDLEPPVLEFPVLDTDVIHIIWGYGLHGEFFHGGIDYGCNTSVYIKVPCDVEVIGIETWIYSTDPVLWQTKVQLKFNEKYQIDISFESWAQNETYANFQRDAINVTEGQLLQEGDIIGMLLYHGSGTHIDFALMELGIFTCPYQFFTTEARSIFNTLWDVCGYGDDSWYTTPTTTTLP